VRRVAREPAATAANIDAEIICARLKAALQGSHNGCCDARRVPVHAHHSAERLKPEGVAQAREEERCAVVLDDGFGDGDAQFGHPLGKPLRNAAAVKREICDSSPFHAVFRPKKN
jgi:hypothetical protein